MLVVYTTLRFVMLVGVNYRICKREGEGRERYKPAQEPCSVRRLLFQNLTVKVRLSNGVEGL